jgi:hypothetical protein
MKITACNPEFHAAVLFYAQALGIDHLDFEVSIDYLDDTEMFGAAQLMYYKDQAVISVNTTQSETDDELELIAHEMVHVKQYVTGQMVDSLMEGVVIWEGTAYNAPSDGRSWAYWNSPWELEAFGRQRGLNFMRSISK